MGILQLVVSKFRLPRITNQEIFPIVDSNNYRFWPNLSYCTLNNDHTN